MIEVNEFIERRNRIIEKMDDNSILILFAGVAKTRSEDEDYPFSINRNFYYLTNIEQENSILVIRKNDGYLKEALYLSTYDPLVEKWTGKRLTLEEAKTISGIENCLYLSQIEADLKEELSFNPTKIYLDLSKFYDVKTNKNIDFVVDSIKNDLKNVEISNIYSEIVKLRMVKSEAEINEFRKAISITSNALKTLMLNLKEDKKEYEFTSLFYHEIHSQEHSELSFPTISAAGKNATCLHYTTSFDNLNKNDLILFDLGATHNYYCADISRTYPINGKFSSLQKKIYEIVLDANKLVIKEAKPGVTIKELNKKVTDFMAKECVKEGLINTEEEIKDYYFHSVSHFIGLDTHDPSASEENLRYGEIKLEKGHVISDEPGLYFANLGIGVRIEDDLLITEDGCLNLSEEIIKDVHEIEKFMKGGRK